MEAQTLAQPLVESVMARQRSGVQGGELKRQMSLINHQSAHTPDNGLQKLVYAKLKCALVCMEEAHSSRVGCLRGLYIML